MAITSQLAPGSIAKPGVCTSSTRPASPYDGQVIYQQDTDQAYVWNGSSWVLLSTGTVNPPGLEWISTTTPASSTTIGVNSVFSSAYKNYRVVFNGTNASVTGTLYFRLRKGGTSSGYQNNYNWGGWVYYTTTAAGNNIGSASSAFNLCVMSGASYTQAVIELGSPNEARPTTISNVANSWYSNFAGVSIAGYKNDSEQYDGIEVYQDAGGTLTGTFIVYGYKS